MKKYVFLLFAGIVGLASCGDDEVVKPLTPELNKLTSVVCYKNEAGTPEFAANITYTNEGKLYKIEETGRYSSQFTYDGNTLSATNFILNSAGLSMPDRTVYSLSDGVIVKKEEWVQSDIANEMYVNNMYQYGYDRYKMYTINWTARWPKADGTGYEEREYKDAYHFDWLDDNVVRYIYAPQKEMVYEYSNQLHPANFPLRVINTTRPVGLDICNPVNLMMGSMGQFLPTRAYWYNVPEVNTKCAEYTFNYSGTAQYINTMTITENIYAASGSPAETNVYKYTFEYNYKGAL